MRVMGKQEVDKCTNKSVMNLQKIEWCLKEGKIVILHDIEEWQRIYGEMASRMYLERYLGF